VFKQELWEDILLRHVRQDYKRLQMRGVKLKASEICNLRSAVCNGDMKGRIVPIDFRLPLTPDNAAIVRDDISSIMRVIIRTGDVGFYKHVLSFYFRDL
jgi:hypothetical protein